MKITMITESLGSGGAERQLCMLAVEMKKRGHDVLVATYAPGDFYAGMLAKAGVEHRYLGGEGRWQWLGLVRRFLRENRQDVVLAFTESSANYAELSTFPGRSWGLVVSERCAEPHSLKWVPRARKLLHLLADVVTTNSHTNRLMLSDALPLLSRRIFTIYNAVDLDKFTPAAARCSGDAVRLVTAARFNEQKNVLRTIEALDQVRRRCPVLDVTIDWFGNPQDDPGLWRSCLELISRLGLEERFRLHEPTVDIVTQYQSCDAVLLPSLFEGLPNTVCEAMACGRPVLMSSVCDAGNIVKENQNGYLFSPTDISSIADAIAGFATLPLPEREAMGRCSREMAERYFDVGKFGDMYENILTAAWRREKPSCGHWLQDVPQTALKFCKKASN